jgi:hypothetical protein
MPTLPIQEVAYNTIQITASNVNFKYVEISYYEVYNYNPNDNTYTGIRFKRMTIPVDNISATFEQDTNADSLETMVSLVIKNGTHTVIAWNSNDWSIGLSGPFQYAELNTYYEAIRDITLA